jgi:hypothetical protein
MYVLDQGIGGEQGEDAGRRAQSGGVVADPDEDAVVLRADARRDAGQQSKLSKIGDARPVA